jgi:hypothetical protein
MSRATQLARQRSTQGADRHPPRTRDHLRRRVPRPDRARSFADLCRRPRRPDRLLVGSCRRPRPRPRRSRAGRSWHVRARGFPPARACSRCARPVSTTSSRRSVTQSGRGRPDVDLVPAVGVSQPDAAYTGVVGVRDGHRQAARCRHGRGEPPSGPEASGAFRVIVTSDGHVEEEYDGLTIGGATDAASVVNAHSRVIRIIP